MELAPAPAWLVELLTSIPDPTSTEPRAGDDDELTFTNVIVDEGERPGDAWAATVTWDDLLGRDGWTLAFQDARGEKHWTRPGKDARDGTSATTGYTDADNLKVFTSSMAHAGLDADETYSKLGYLAATKFGGDLSAAAKWLSDEGYGRAQDERPLRQDESSRERAKRDDDDDGPGQDESWPEIIPLGADHVLPPFPLSTLPPWIADYAVEVADDLQVPTDLPAMLALGALSTMLAGKVAINVHGRWHEDVNLFLATSMPPSTGKSPAFKRMAGAVRKLQDEHALAMRAHHATNASLVASLEAKLKRLQQMDEPDVADLETVHQSLFEAREKRTSPLKLVVGDATPEALEKAIGENDERIAIHSTEGGVFTMMTGRYSDASVLDVYLQAFSGDPITTTRIGRGEVEIKKPLLTILITVQPTVIAQLAERPELAGRGLTARFMYSVPVDVVGYRDLTFYDGPDSGLAATYDASMFTLGKQALDWSVPTTLNVERDAAEHYTDWRHSLEARMRPTGDLRHMAEWVGKLWSTTLRVAALLHMADDPGGTTRGRLVSLSTMARAIAVGEYWLRHAAHVYDVWGTSTELAEARKIVDWIKANGLETFTVRELYMALRRTFPTPDATTLALTMLVERGWVRPEDRGPVTPKRGSRSTLYVTHPQLSTVDVDVAHVVSRDDFSSSSLSFDDQADVDPSTNVHDVHEPDTYSPSTHDPESESDDDDLSALDEF